MEVMGWVSKVWGSGGNGGKSVDEIGHINTGVIWCHPSLVGWVVCSLCTVHI